MSSKSQCRELLLAMQAKFSQWLRSRATPEAVNSSVDPKGVSEDLHPSPIPAEDICKSLNSVSSFTEIKRATIWAYVAQNSSQNNR